MEITLNNTKENFTPAELSISEILKIKNFTFKMLVTKVNGNFIKRDDYDKVFVKNGDNVSIIHLISGG
ncbi:MAG: thiamine biosynthesis protein ThiS [Bacteroidetes bacterium CG_4_10_14_3_um_filter_31_20]|nr:MAG: thiamine biosynthesis protein ThiS [Bacteroidetes bacterium CG_4_8_14_3_um_filter_31_14]PIY04345.1 MAG: thiamine biosynthesis protein ThiS [Bacteroidetes bacterium CG_4_10_14_3_um_filter_31_20]